MKNGKHMVGFFLLVTIKYIKIGRITTKTSILSQEIEEKQRYKRDIPKGTKRTKKKKKVT